MSLVWYKCLFPFLKSHEFETTGYIFCTGVFDQHGCPLIIFPVDGQAKLSELNKPEIVDFINYFKFLHKYVELRLTYVCVCAWVLKAVQAGLLLSMFSLHSRNEEKQILVSAVADLRHASLPTTRFIAETLLLLEVLSWQRELSGYWLATCSQYLPWN